MGKFLAVIATLGLVLFAGWLALRRGDIPYDQLESLYANADSRYVSLAGGTRLHFRDTGPRDAPVILLVHGFSASLHTWEPWVAELRRQYRVISLDLPGHGLSGCIDNQSIGPTQFVEVIEKVTRAARADRFTIAGSSMGGSAAWNYVLSHPERVDALVLIGASGWLPDGDETSDRPLAFRLLDFGPARAAMRDLDLSAIIRSGLRDSFFDPLFVTDEMVERYSAFSRAPCHRDAMINLVSGRGERRAATPELMARIERPTLVIHGIEDRVVPASGGRRFGETIPDAEVILYEETGHLPHEERALESVEALKDFLQRRVHSAAGDEARESPE